MSVQEWRFETAVLDIHKSLDTHVFSRLKWTCTQKEHTLGEIWTFLMLEMHGYSVQ